MTRRDEEAERLELIEQRGPWPFISRRSYRRPDGVLHVRESRAHRKGFHRAAVARAGAEGRWWWIPGQLNWWIGVLFALGASLFALGAVLALVPALARAWSLGASGINAVFFAGSFPFTIAAYLQLYQAANAGALDSSGASRVKVWLGWRPGDIGWLSCVLQLMGTLLFNVNTFDALLPNLDWLQQDLVIWGPDIAGSVLFLVSGHLAFAETCHAHWAWRPTSLSWCVVFANLLGCVAFMISAVFAFVPPAAPTLDALTTSITFTLIGALGFLVGSLLILPETAKMLPETAKMLPETAKMLPGTAKARIDHHE